MGFNNFRLNVVARIALLGALIATAGWASMSTSWQLTPIAAAVLAVLLAVDLIRYVESVNRELAAFLTFVAHDDFTASATERGKGKVFRELEAAYSLLTGRFRRLNVQRAADHQYLESLIEHVSVALVCFDASGSVRLMNRQAKSLFGVPHLASKRAFARIDPRLAASMDELGDGGRTLIGLEIGGERMQLALYATEFELLGGHYKVVSFQNIRDELEQREIDYAQKLIKVLRHEIMNSVTPIISLTKLLEDRLVDRESGRVTLTTLSNEERRDLARGLASIQSRGAGLLRFVQAYGDLTNLPRPNFAAVDVRALLDRVRVLMTPSLDGAGIRLDVETMPASLVVRADAQQIEQVLINLVQNATEALNGRADGRVLLRAAMHDRGHVLVQVVDNGAGIDDAHLEEIFVPFFTTKRNGTGVGLSVSRQIMLLNGGLLTVNSVLGRGSEFTLRFRS
jgi:nitrogen fixation/metabolism regulation signal transduction histidine kinase